MRLFEKRIGIGRYTLRWRVRSVPGWKTKGSTAFLLVCAGRALCSSGLSVSLAADRSVWNPVRLDPVPEQGSILDLSGLNSGPCGDHGFIEAREGNLFFSRLPDVAQRFYGGNLAFNTHFPSRDDAVRIADKFQRMGYNIVRVHHKDAVLSWSEGIFSIENGEIILNEERMDRLDFLMAELRKRGIYANVDLYVLFRPIGLPIFDAYAEYGLNPQDKDHVKLLIYFSPEGFELWRHLSKLYLEHVNPYTGLAIKDDPMFVGISPVNEDWLMVLTSPGSTDEPTRNFVLSRFNRYLKDNGLAEAESFPVNLYREKDSYAHANELVKFYTQVHENTFNAMRAVLKETGVQTPITGLNWMAHNLANYWRYTLPDVQEFHYYFSERIRDLYDDSLPKIDGRSPFKGYRGRATGMRERPSESMRNGLMDPSASNRSEILRYSTLQMHGKPLYITEWNGRFPAAGREEAALFTGAIGAVRDWDVLNRFSYTWRAESIVTEEPLGSAGQLMIANDPMNHLSEYMGALLFRTGYLKSSPIKYLCVRDEDTVRNQASVIAGSKESAGEIPIPKLYPTSLLYTLGTVFVPASREVAYYRIGPDSSVEDVLSGNVSQDDTITVSGSADWKEIARAFIVKEPDASIRQMQMEGLEHDQLISDTGELTFDLKRKTFLVKSPYVVAASGAIGGRTIDLGGVTLQCTSDSGTFFMSSADGKPLVSSERILLLYFTEVRATGDQWKEEGADLIYHIGSLPTQVREEQASIRLTRPLPLKAYACSMGGTRLAEIPVQSESGDLVFEIDTQTGFVFELAAGRD